MNTQATKQALIKDGWIPVTEKLPDNSDIVYVTVTNGTWESVLDGYWNLKEWRVWRDGTYRVPDGEQVLAWMEKPRRPDPFKG